MLANGDRAVCKHAPQHLHLTSVFLLNTVASESIIKISAMGLENDLLQQKIMSSDAG